MTRPVCFDLHRLAAGVANLLRIGIGLDIALNHTNPDLITQVLDRAGNGRGLARTGRRDDIQTKYIVLFEKGLVLFGTFFITAQNFLIQ